MPNSVISNNRRIAKNTIYLYIRMIITLVVTLYTSRVILKNLGIEDFGIYNIIGGVIVLFSFISVALRVATQRFVSFELGLEENGDPNRVFCMSLQCLFIISIIVVVLAETVGLWFVNTQLDIPEVRVSAAGWVYQITILSFIANLIVVPYQATIIAYEKMSFYAYVSIIDVVLKLGVALFISICSFDKLIAYSFLLFIVNCISVLLSAFYCQHVIKIGSFRIVRDKNLFKQIMGFSGWSMVNGGAVITAQQGGNILLNVFNGVVANGAYGIANQVTNAIYHFVSNFQSAFQPQIVKQYAAGEQEGLSLLMNRASVFSYYLLLIIAVPFCVSSDYVLRLWLGEVPQYSVGFCQLMLAYFLIDALEAPLWMLIGATGKMKVYTIWSAAITVFNIPLSWLLLRSGFSVYWVFIVRAGLNYVCGIIRPFYVRYLVKSFSLRVYLKALVRPLAVTAILGVFALTYYLSHIQIHPLFRVILSFFLCVVIIWLCGLNIEEKVLIKNTILKRLGKYQRDI